MSYPWQIDYMTRCAALRRRGLSRELVHDLQTAGSPGTLAELEQLSDAALVEMTRLDERLRATADRVAQQATHVVWWKPSTGEVVAVAELGERVPTPDPVLRWGVPLPLPDLWDGDQA